jgi:hypothetical protein
MRTVGELGFGILGYKEKNEWVALALEFDIRGYGKTFKAARKELQDLVKAQIAFALFKNQPEMIWKPADPIWCEVYSQARRELLGRPNTKKLQYLAAASSIPPAFISSKLNQFQTIDASP